MSAPKVCDHCGQVIKQTHKEVLNKHKLKMLKMAALHVIETGVNDFTKRDLEDTLHDDLSHSDYANFPKLRYHGLITPGRDKAGNRIKGRWLITRNGWAYLRGELGLPAYVLVQNNSIKTRSEMLVKFTDVWRGEATVQTTFEYFDDDGNQVGFRPAMPVISEPSGQTRLI